MITNRKMITIDEDKCNGCGQCVPACAEGALQIVDGKAKLVSEVYCDGLGACLGECPMGALKVEERPVADFDPDAVKARLEELGREVPDHMPSAEELRGTPVEPRPSGGCPGSRLHTLSPCQQANKPRMQQVGMKLEAGQGSVQSQLGHWPVQLRLVPPSAPFLKNADLLLTADCVPVALPQYHSEFVAGRVVTLGCPKFDDAQSYIEKLAGIIAENDLNSITLLEMEVPCCSSMSAILREAFNRSGRKVPTERIIVGLNGEIKDRSQI